jgi:hypothetical protein
VEYNSAVIKVDWLAAYIALLKEIGAVFVIFLWRWVGVQFAQSCRQWETRADT